MWNCEHCGCMAIAGDQEKCPMCATARPEPPLGVPTSEEEGKPDGEQENEATSGSQDPDSPQVGPSQSASSEVPSAGGFLTDGGWS